MHSIRHACAVLLLVVPPLTALAAPAPAQVEPLTGAPPARPVVLTISGGVSLGSYQGGLNWALVEFMRRSREEDGRFRRAFSPEGAPPLSPHFLAAMTGASAGNINALLSVVEWCRGSGPVTPEESLFWRIWVTTGIEQLMARPAEGHGDELAIFSRLFFREHHYPLIRERIGGDVREGCGAEDAADQPGDMAEIGVPLGLTLTRLEPAEVEIEGSGLTALTQRFASVLTARVDDRIGGADPDPKLVFEQAPLAIRGVRGIGELVHLSSDIHGRIEEHAVFDLSEASSAFPLAFEPKELEYYPDEALPDTSAACPRQGAACVEPESDFFIDGGVFDNNPLDLAMGIYRGLQTGLDAPERFTTREGGAEDMVTRARRLETAGLRGYDDAEGIADEPLFVYMNPGELRGRLRAVRRERRTMQRPGGVVALRQLLSGALPSARQYELHALARTLARDTTWGQARWIRMTTRGYPLVSEHLGAFAGFLGRPFREYDFYVGVYDGLHFVAREMICGGDAGPAECLPTQLRRLIEEQPLPLGDAAPVVLDHIYRVEFPTERPPDVGQPEHQLVLETLLDANQDLIREVENVHCDGLGLPQYILCLDGFRDMLDHFATPAVRDSLDAWSRNAETCGPEMILEPETCRAERAVVDLVNDPPVYMNKLFEDVLFQVWRVEEHRDGHGERNSSRLIELGELAYPYTSARYRRGFDDFSSIPHFHRGFIGWLARLVPYYAAVELRGSDAFEAELGYRPGWHLSGRAGHHLAVTLPFTPVHYRNGPGEDRFHLRGRLGVGLALKNNNALWNGMDLVPYELIWNWGGGKRSFASGFDMYGLLGKARLGVRRVWDGPLERVEGGKWSVTVGFADLNGVLYWLWR